MTIDTEALLIVWLALAISIVLPCVLFLAARRWRLFFRLALAVLLPWALLVLFYGIIGQPVEEAYYYAHRPDPNSWEANAIGYDDLKGGAALLALGWLNPLLVCMLTAAVSFIVRRICRVLRSDP